MKRVLIANIFGIGDVLFTTPLAANLKKELAGVKIDYLCNARTKQIVEHNPDIADVFVYEKDDLVKLWNHSRVDCLKAIYNLFSSIREKKYDTVFDFTLSRKFGFFFMLAGIRKRIGLNYKKRGTFLTEALEFSGFSGKHVIEYYLGLLKFIGAEVRAKEMKLLPDEASLDWAKSYRREHVTGEAPLVAIVPGGGASWGMQASRKRWDEEGFLRAADILAGSGVEVAILGDNSEELLCQDIAEKMTSKPVFVENNLSLDKYIALLSVCDLVLCNDGGPLHIAVALGRKTVSIFGPVDERVYGPYPSSPERCVITAQEIPCRPCYGKFKLPECDQKNRCLVDIEPEDVADKCLELLGKPQKV